MPYRPSSALRGATRALREIAVLQSVHPAPTGAPPVNLALTLALGRASVVLISSHLERYIRNINDELASGLTRYGVASDLIPERVRLRLVQRQVDELAQMQWTSRATGLRSFVAAGAPLWTTGAVPIEIEADRLLDYMKAPVSQALVRYYKYWGITDVFGATRRAPPRIDLRLMIDELVTKRNNIAHGDTTVNATQGDVRAYVTAVATFCTRSDKVLFAAITSQFGMPQPW